MTSPNPNLKRIREAVNSRDAWNRFTEERISEAVTWIREQSADPHVQEICGRIVETNLRRSAAVIFDHTESPIEKIFLGSLFTLFADFFPGGMVFEPPIANAPAFMSAYQSMHKIAISWWADYADQTEETDWEDFRRWLEQRVSRTPDSTWEIDLLFNQVVSTKVGFTGAYYFVPQAGFPDFKIDGHSIRTDLLIWRADNDRKTIIECDGFLYHKNKQSFISDRKRFRLFRHKGYDIFPFSGSEIYTEPEKSAGEIFGYLLYHHEKVVFSEENPNSR
ncbi:MAG: hypothetical protein Q7S40_15440 [Opitutaceae bacterium]|nr:hypothetical protein [Opitutaceae bacterium]